MEVSIKNSQWYKTDMLYGDLKIITFQDLYRIVLEFEKTNNFFLQNNIIWDSLNISRLIGVSPKIYHDLLNKNGAFIYLDKYLFETHKEAQNFMNDLEPYIIMEKIVE